MDDCARGLVALAERPEAAGEVFFLASPATTDALEHPARGGARAGRARPGGAAPAAVVRGAAAVAERRHALTGRRLPLNRKLAAQVLAPGWVCDPAKARERLGFEARTPLAESIAARGRLVPRARLALTRPDAPRGLEAAPRRPCQAAPQRSTEAGPMAEPRRAAFYDVDGTLVRTNIVHAFAFYAMNQGSILGTAWQTARTVLSLPLFAAADRVNRKVFNELFYRYYAGQSEDRLETLAEELFEDVLKPAIYPGTPTLIDEARRAGCRIVLVTGALDFTVRPLAAHLGADDLIANRMQFVQRRRHRQGRSRPSSRARTRRS